MPIQRKLTLTIMGISLAAILLTVMAITLYLIYDMRKEKMHELSVTASLTGDRNSAGIMFFDNQKVQANLEIFQQNPAILSACIYDAQGALFASYSGDSSGMACPAEKSALPKAIEGLLLAHENIEKSNEAVGSVYLVSDMRGIDAYVKKILMISATAAGCVLALTWMLTAYFQRTISAPILDLASRVQIISDTHDYQLNAPTYTGETGILANAFNRLIAEVRKRDEALKRVNETLEEKVVVRTQQLAESVRKAEAANEAKSEFLRNMSHEFRTPLHAITSFTAYGIKEHETADRSELKRYFEILARASERLTRLVNQVLDLARLEQGETTLITQSSDLNQLAARAAELIEPLAKDKEITLNSTFVGEPLKIACDADKIIQVITNLLGNAVKFSPRGSRIELRSDTSIESGVPMTQISVRDEGVGIPENELEEIFESFRQSSRTNTGAGGTGLGLAISRGIIGDHGGKIWAENNTSANGSTFVFVLPRYVKDNTTTTPEVEVRYGHAA
jgi:signal transduction histidine kinase